MTDFSAIFSKIVEPFDGGALNASALDLRLGNKSYKYTLSAPYVVGDEISDRAQSVSDFTEYTVEAGETVFIGIKEKISLPPILSALVLPRSSVTRLGLDVSVIYVHPGYAGILPLTITNHCGVPVVLKPGVRIAQLVLFNPASENFIPYDRQTDAKYFDENVSHSKIEEDRDLIAIRKAVKAKFPFASED